MTLLISSKYGALEVLGTNGNTQLLQAFRGEGLEAEFWLALNTH